MPLLELGRKYPCVEEGIAINLDEVEPSAGDVLEMYFECDRDITTQEAARTIFEIAKVKDDYPGSVIHYVNIEPRRITIQYSIAPPGGHASPLVWWYVLIYIAAIIALILVVTAAIRGWLFPFRPPTGKLSLSAVGCDDTECSYPYGLEVAYTVDDKSGVTPDLIEDLTPGTYTVTWGYKEGYQTPSPKRVPVVADETVSVTAKYFEDGVIPPDTGLFIIDTSPVKGMIYVDAVEMGIAPQECEVDTGPHVVSFGDVEGYEAPASQTWDVAGGDVIAVTGTYKPVGVEVSTWLFIGGGAAIGALGGLASRNRAIGIPVGVAVGAGLGYVAYKIYEAFQ